MHATKINTARGLKVCVPSPPKIKFIQRFSADIYGSRGQNNSNPAVSVPNSISSKLKPQILNNNSTSNVLIKVDNRKKVKDIIFPTCIGTKCLCNTQHYNYVEQNLRNNTKQQLKTDLYNKSITVPTRNWEMPAHNVAIITDNGDIRPTVPVKQQSLKEQSFDDGCYESLKYATTNSHTQKNYHPCSRINLKQIAITMEEYQYRLHSVNVLPHFPNIHALITKNNCKVINLCKIGRNEVKGSSNNLKSNSKIPVKLTTALDGSMLYCCSECVMAYSSKELLEEHFIDHKKSRRIECDDCGVSLKRKEHLKQHNQADGHDRPFACDVCQKAFKRNEHLKRHVVTHSGDKSHVCFRCGKAFLRKDHLIKHLIIHRQEDSTATSRKKKL